IVVRFDGRGSTMDRKLFDQIGVNRSRSQPFGIRKLFGLSFKDVDKYPSDGFSLGLRFGQSFQSFIKFLTRPNPNDVEPHFFVTIQYIFKFVFPQQPVVDKNAYQILPNRLVKQTSSYRGIHPTAQTQYHLVPAYFCPDKIYCYLYKTDRRPVRAQTNDAD